MTRGYFVEYGKPGRPVEDGPFRGLAYAITHALSLQVIGHENVRVTQPDAVDLGMEDGLTRDEREQCVDAGLEGQ